MRLYQTLIVDDEAEAREGIVQCVSWRELGFEIIAQAGNGSEALELAEGMTVDVVLTDIRMPFMDGLTMCRRLAALYPELKVVILSGFDEFEYAKEAIRLNVAEYILKPVNAGELTEILKRVKRSLDERVEKARDINALREGYARALPLMREHFLSDLVWRRRGGAELEAGLARYDLSIRSAPFRAVAAFEVDEAPGRAAAVSPELAPVLVRRLAEEQLARLCQAAVFYDATAVVAITAWDTMEPIDLLMAAASDICAQAGAALNLAVTAGIGRLYEGAENIRDSFREAKAALEYKTIAGAGRAIYINDMERERGRTAAMTGRESELLLSLIKFGSREQVDRLIADIFERSEGGALERRVGALRVFDALCRIVGAHGLWADAHVSELLTGFLDSPGAWGDADAARARLTDICEWIGKQVREERESAAKGMADEAMRFIEERYQDSGLNAEALCGRLHVSQSYFSTVFKRETGKGFVQYVTELRLDRAAELLLSSDAKTYEVARMVGYDEPNYFSYVFKKRFGVSPVNYRREGAKP